MKTIDYWGDLKALNKQISVAIKNQPIVENSTALDWYESILRLMKKRDAVFENIIHELGFQVECFGIDLDHKLNKKQNAQSQA